MKYIKCRLKEKSTWVAIGVGITAASALPAPWSYVFLAVSVIGVLVPGDALSKKQCP